MPRATVSMEPQRTDLRTCPGGFVAIRRMTFGELMASQDMAYQVRAKAMDTDNPEIGMDLSRAAVMEYQFSKCVVEHNLTDDSDRPLDFRLSRDVHLLDSNVGQEIQEYIDDVHNWKKQFPNSGQPSGNESSTNGQVKMAESSDEMETLQTSSSQ